MTNEEELASLHVDHLITNLENLSIKDILDFLAKYCGWKLISTYVWNKMLSAGVRDGL